MEPEAEIIRAQLFALRDEAYRIFHSALMPTVAQAGKTARGHSAGRGVFTGPAAWILRREQPPRVSDRTYPGLRQGAG